ncbi:hypothetical protein ELY33_17075 [Vreelandella andesensis]|uniref:Uncharacterized protein n=1 Tax=Vreelandella andesensis TaxID=447567 RepID=A0A433KEZ5_9GAMM|nr:hypothetical protein [Halomonas andesensis]RUR26820.1 hypothetical protein ELY33_17075 [Halomonas andesensis]
MKLTAFELAQKPVSTKKPKGARYRAVYSIVDNNEYRADLATAHRAPEVAKKWGIAASTVRQHRCNLRKRGEL